MGVRSSTSTDFNPSSHPDVFNNLDDSGYDSGQGDWRHDYNFAIGRGTGPQVLAVNGYADNSVDIGLQTVVPADTVSISVALGDIVDLNAFANAGASGTVTSSATSQGSLTLTNGSLNGSYTASMSIDVTAYIAADQASVHLQIFDTFQLSLAGSGYVGASLAETSASGGTVTAMTPSSGGGKGTGEDARTPSTFDLARFAASVLNTGQDHIQFVGSAPGESLHGSGTSVLTIHATADVPGYRAAEDLRFSQTERSNVAFNENRPSMTATAYGTQEFDANSTSMFHS